MVKSASVPCARRRYEVDGNVVRISFMEESYVQRVPTDDRSAQLRYYHRRKAKLAEAGGNVPPEKLCKRCGATKVAAEFGVHAGKPDGLQSWCKACFQAHRDSRKSESLLRSRRFRERHPHSETRYLKGARDEAIAHYSATDPPQCSCCGESEPAFLVLDHIDGGGNQERRKYGRRLFIRLRNLGYPPGYQVLCWNCNSAKYYQGQCPHQKGR